MTQFTVLSDIVATTNPSDIAKGNAASAIRILESGRPGAAESACWRLIDAAGLLLEHVCDRDWTRDTIYTDRGYGLIRKPEIHSRMESASRGTVYFLADLALDTVKIGFTIKPLFERIKQLQTGNPRPLRILASIPGTVELERQLHRILDRYRLVGEWFTAAPSVLRAACLCTLCTSANEFLERWNVTESRASHSGASGELSQCLNLDGGQAEGIREAPGGPSQQTSSPVQAC